MKAAVVLLLALALPGQAAATFRPSPIRHVSVDGASLGFRTIGSGPGPPLVMIPGTGLTMTEWDPAFIAPLAAKRQVIVFDLRGVSSSTGSVRRLSIPLLARDTARLIRRLGHRRADVLGWSLGGYIAEKLALRFPRVVRRLVLCGSDPGGPHAVQTRNARALRLVYDPNATPQQLLPVLLPNTPAAQARGAAWYSRLGRWPGITAASFHVAPAALAAQVRAEGAPWYSPRNGVFAGLPDFPFTLVADGKCDIIVLPANARILHRRIRRSELVLFGGAGHAFLFQYPRLFARRVNTFLG